MEADNRIDNQAQILSKDATLILESGAHLPRSDKGAILRRETYQKFERQISQAYERLQDANEYDTNYFLDGKLLEENTQALIQNRLDLRKPDRACDFDAALFELGMKSLDIQHLKANTIGFWLHYSQRYLLVNIQASV